VTASVPSPDRLATVRAAGPWLDRLRLPDGWIGRRVRVAVACSGGADSLALLVLATAAELDVVAVHVDHGLRPDSAVDGTVVAAAAARLGVPARAVAVVVADGGSLEATARDARYVALEGARAEVGAEAVLVGHTRDDQAETVLLQLLRGAGTTGLAGMPAVRGSIVRPLLDLGRADTVELCARAGLAPVADPTNGDERFRRNWVRRTLLPVLAAGADRDVAALLARTADVVRDDVALLDDLADDALGHLGDPPVAAALAALAPALAARVVRRWLGDPPPSRTEVARVLAVARGEARAAELAGGRGVERAGGLLVARPSRADRADRADGAPTWPAVALDLPGAAVAGGVRVEAWIDPTPPVRWPDGRWTAVLDADVAGGHAVLRPARAGDRMQPLGLAGTRPVGELLAELGVPPGERRRHPVLARPDGGALWVLGYRVDDRARVTTATARFLWVRAAYEATGPAPRPAGVGP
jgi:tRNA(Ile)-lysidine synthase